MYQALDRIGEEKFWTLVSITSWITHGSAGCWRAEEEAVGFEKSLMCVLKLRPQDCHLRLSPRSSFVPIHFVSQGPALQFDFPVLICTPTVSPTSTSFCSRPSRPRSHQSDSAAIPSSDKAGKECPSRRDLSESIDSFYLVVAAEGEELEVRGAKGGNGRGKWGFVDAEVDCEVEE